MYFVGTVFLICIIISSKQVQKCPGQWIPVPPIDDTIVVNIGDLMEKWTNDRFVSTVSALWYYRPLRKVRGG